MVCLRAIILGKGIYYFFSVTFKTMFMRQCRRLFTTVNQTKVCHTCKTALPVSRFHKHSCRVDGLQSQCKLCMYHHRFSTSDRYLSSIFQNAKHRQLTTNPKECKKIRKVWCLTLMQQNYKCCTNNKTTNAVILEFYWHWPTTNFSGTQPVA